MQSGERFYMRMLLNLVAGAQSFEDVRTVAGIVYPTYKEACFHMGLLDSDKEWHLALSDASSYATAPHLRELFVTMLVFCEVSSPSELWEKHWAALSDDVEYRQRKLTGIPTLILNEADKQALALDAIIANSVQICDDRKDSDIRNRKRDAEDDDSREFTTEELNEVQQMRNTPDFFNKLVDSMAPTIFGHQESNIAYVSGWRP